MLPGDNYLRGAVHAAIRAMAAGSLLLGSVPASAAEACGFAIRAEGLGEGWTHQVEAVRADLAQREDVDPCASIFLRPSARGALVLVTLNDGRSAERTVSDPVDLRAVATALVLLPSPSASQPPPPAEVAPRDPQGAPAHASSPIDSDGTNPPGPPPVDQAPHTVRGGRPLIDLAGMGGTRWSGAAPAGAVGAFADVRVDGWVLGARGRWDGYAASGSHGYTTQAFEIGAEAGRDFRAGPTTVTFLATPSFVSLSQKFQSAPPSVYVPSPNPKTRAPIGYVTASAREGQVARLGGMVRWTLLSGTRLRLFVAADAEVDVMSDPGNRVPTALAATGELPTWSAGLSLGGAASVWP